MKTSALAIAFFATVVFAQGPVGTNSTSTSESANDGVIAQFVDGGAWKSTITLVNVDTVVSNYTIKFYGDNGAPLSFQTSDGTGVTLSGSLPVNGSHVIETLGTAANQSTGWARIVTSARTGGNAVFRQRVAGRPDFEASMPIMQYLDNIDYVVPFDNFAAANGLALVNPSTVSNITAFLAFRNEQGVRFYLDSVDLAPLQHTSFDLATKFPPSAGIRGALEITAAGGTINVLALRFVGAAFTSLLPLAK